MVYLMSFRMPTQDDEENYMIKSKKASRTCYTTKYPFGLFRHRELPEFYFTDITVFCGNNGSGKSSILNVMGEKLRLERTAPFNRSDFFEDYVDLCDYQLDKTIPKGSKIITSDGVFEKVLDIRRINDGIDVKRADLIDEYIAANGPGAASNLLQGLDDYDRWKQVSDMRSRNRTQSRFLKENLMRNITERSNGESALSYFVDSIQENALYLLDEPENSLSPQNQLQLKYFIEDSVRNFGCQFVISTHSPFLLSLGGALIYNIDETPPAERKWTELDCVRVYHDFFEEQRDKFI
ncbi:MAG: AAA family ATPase [Clostridia bacterium]|nr:AAA family ATPase [Clostridia bacterium]MBQ7048349.1 AAA family ATPase [Clostridia bacterium]